MDSITPEPNGKVLHTSKLNPGWLNVEKTANDRGFMFLRPLDSFHYWTSSLPYSHLPLLDLGSAYGVNTFHGMLAGRDVIAADMDPTHLKFVRKGAEVLKRESNDRPLGRLIDTKVVTLPYSDAMQEESVSGILLSEVLHFFRPGEPEGIIKDAYKWLCPGGNLVVACASWRMFDHEVIQKFFKLDGDHCLETMRELITAADESASAMTREDLATIPPFYMIEKDKNVAKKRTGYTFDRNLLLHSISHLNLMAKNAGFEVVKSCYISPKRYPRVPKDVDGETALLVARKPLDA